MDYFRIILGISRRLILFFRLDKKSCWVDEIENWFFTFFWLFTFFYHKISTDCLKQRLRIISVPCFPRSLLLLPNIINYYDVFLYIHNYYKWWLLFYFNEISNLIVFLIQTSNKFRKDQRLERYRRSGMEAGRWNSSH